MQPNVLSRVEVMVRLALLEERNNSDIENEQDYRPNKSKNAALAAVISLSIFPIRNRAQQILHIYRTT